MANLELGPKGSLELEGFLAGLDDGDEFVPVDNFFGSYLEELGARSKRAHEPGGPFDGASKSAKLSPQQTAGMAALSGLPGLVPQAGVADGMQPAALPGGMLGQQQGGMMLPGGGPGLQMPGMPGAPMLGGGMPGGLPGMMGTGAGQMPLPLVGMQGGLPGGLSAGFMPPTGANNGTAGLILDAAAGYGSGPGLAASGGAAGSDGASGGEGHGGGHGGGGKHRGKTLKQQEANKVAQQRYRERKKQKFTEMEATIEQLSKRLASLQALQSRNQILEGLNGDLTAQLLSKEREVERLKVALDSAAEKSLGSQPSSPSANGGAGSGAEDRLECDDNGCVTCDVLPRDLAGIDYKKGFSDQVQRLRLFVAEHGLDQGPALPAEGLPREVFGELAQLVGRSCQLCQAALRMEGVKVMELISKDPHSFSAVGDAAEQQRWQACLSSMQLSGEQVETLLLSRRSHLQRMREIYQERHNLNMQAMSLMLPHSSRNPADDNTVEGRLANMSDVGYLRVARSSAELGEVLDKIKDNLRREQRLVMDLNCLLMSKILTPLQGARYLLGAYPHHCDALALSNVLAKNLGREAGSEGPAHRADAAEASTGGCAAPGC